MISHFGNMASSLPALNFSSVSSDTKYAATLTTFARVAAPNLYLHRDRASRRRVKCDADCGKIA